MISNSGTAVVVLENQFRVPKDIRQQGIWSTRDDSNNLNHLIIHPRYKISDGFSPKRAMGPSDRIMTWGSLVSLH